MLRFERPFVVSVARPAWHSLGEALAVALRIVVSIDVVRIVRCDSTVGRDGLFDCGIEDRPSDRDGDAVLARALEAGVGRTGTGCWEPVLDADEVLVLARVGVARVRDANAPGSERELERFVLRSFPDTVRERQSRQWMRGVLS